MNHGSEIYDISNECEDAFNHLLVTTDTSALQPFDTLYQRFHQWVSYLGVFAEEHMSLDARLGSSDSASLKNMVLQLLEIIKRNLETFKSYNGQISWDLPAASRPTGSKDSEQEVASATAETLQALEAAMDSLYRLGIAIRQTSTRDPTAKISSYMTKEDKDGSLQKRFSVMVKYGLLDRARNGREVDGRKNDGPPISLCEQLATSVCFRYFGILYYRNRQHQLESVRKPASKSEAADSEDAKPSTPNVKLPGGSFTGMPHKAGRNPYGSKSVSEGPTNPNPWQVLRRFHSQSVVGDVSTVSIPLHQFEYPDPPKINPPAKHVACPYCTKPIGQGIVTDKRLWERHVNDDLKLYACISEQCLDPPQLFARYNDWLQHMEEEHSPRWAEEVHLEPSWSCDMDHDTLYFDREIDFEAHIQIEHPECDTESEVAELTDWCVIKFKRKPYTCPLCSCVPKEIALIMPGLAAEHPAESAPVRSEHDMDFRRKLSQHVAAHLKGIGLMSLRYLDDGSEGGAAESKNAATSVSGEGRLREDIPEGGLDADFAAYITPPPPELLDGEVFELDWPTILSKERPRLRVWSVWGEWMWSRTQSRYYRQRQDQNGNIETIMGPVVEVDWTWSTSYEGYYRVRRDNDGNKYTDYSKMAGSEFYDDFPDFHSENPPSDDMVDGEDGRQTPDFPFRSHI